MNIIQCAVIFLVMQYWSTCSSFDETEYSDCSSKRKIFSRYMIWMPTVNLCIAIIAWSFPILERLQLYFTVFNLLAIPYSLEKSHRTYWNKVISLAILLVFFVLYVCGELLFRPEWLSEFNYHFFWT